MLSLTVITTGSSTITLENGYCIVTSTEPCSIENNGAETEYYYEQFSEFAPEIHLYCVPLFRQPIEQAESYIMNSLLYS